MPAGGGLDRSSTRPVPSTSAFPPGPSIHAAGVRSRTVMRTVSGHSRASVARRDVGQRLDPRRSRRRCRSTPSRRPRAPRAASCTSAGERWAVPRTCNVSTSSSGDTDTPVRRSRRAPRRRPRPARAAGARRRAAGVGDAATTGTAARRRRGRVRGRTPVRGRAHRVLTPAPDREVVVVEADHPQLGHQRRRRWRRAPAVAPPITSARTSSAVAPASAWKKLACFGETTAPPTRRPLSPSASMRRPGGVARRVGEHRARVGAPGLVLPPPAHDLGDLGLAGGDVAVDRPGTSAPVTTSCGATGRAPVAEPERGRRAASPGRRRPARSATSAATSTSAVSRPWPPAFMRTAPPTLPGIPT